MATGLQGESCEGDSTTDRVWASDACDAGDTCDSIAAMWADSTVSADGVKRRRTLHCADVASGSHNICEQAGPRDYEDCVNFARHQVDQMLTLMDPTWPEDERGFFRNKFVVTTDYSGMGCPEIAGDLIKDPRCVTVCWGQSDVRVEDTAKPPNPAPLGATFSAVATPATCVELFKATAGGAQGCLGKKDPRQVYVVSNMVGAFVYRFPLSHGQDALCERGVLGSDGGSDFAFHYRACDSEETCRSILLSHRGLCGDGIRHIQGDISERLTRPYLRKMHEILADHQQIFEREVAAMAEGPLAGACMNVLKRDVGRRAISSLQTMLREAGAKAFKDTAYCYKCRQHCATHPPESVRGGRAYINIGGNVCFPWSQMNQTSKGWLDDFTIPMLAWLFDLRLRNVTFLVQECTGMFDVLGFRSMMQDMFYIQHVKFSPVDLGIPAHRLRSYTLCTNKGQVVMRVPFSRPFLQEHFFRVLVTTAEVFFRAPTSYVKAFLLSAVSGAQGVEVAESMRDLEPWDIEAKHYLTKRQAARLQEHMKVASNKGYSFVCCNVMQNDSFMKFDSSCPCVLRAAKIFGHNFRAAAAGSSPRTSRLMTPYEHLATQGLPVLLSSSHKFSKMLPGLLTFAAIYQGKGVSPGVLSSVAGNGMRLAQVGLCLLYCFLASERLPLVQTQEES